MSEFQSTCSRTDKTLCGLPHLGFCMPLFQFCDFARRVIKVACSLDEPSHTVPGLMWQCLACSAPEFSFAFQRGVSRIFHANRFSHAKVCSNRRFQNHLGARFWVRILSILFMRDRQRRQSCNADGVSLVCVHLPSALCEFMHLNCQNSVQCQCDACNAEMGRVVSRGLVEARIPQRRAPAGVSKGQYSRTKLQSKP